MPKTVIGIAVDLDAGTMFMHRNGQWLNGSPPGSGRGVALPRGGPYTADVKSSTSLASLQQSGVLKVNFGESQFERAAPAGYRGFDWPDHLAEVGIDKGVLSGYDSKERVAGEPQSRWVQRSWEWVRSFAPAENPSSDTTGERCGAGQSGPVWFLTGSNRSGSVRRECEVPAGKIVLVPIINTLGQATAEVSCDRLLVSVRQFSSATRDLRFSLDGTALKNPAATLLDTGCFQLRDASTGLSGLAAGTGYWVFLSPLKKGRHVIAFGAKAAGGFEQDVSYVLHVR